MKFNYLKPQSISLKDHLEINEKWVQDLIVNDPSILGLGDLILRDVERLQPRAGRLDILLQDADTKRRYEVELQLGSTDESHIIRTIEYWDIEKRRYPQYEHCAVLIAEDITSRFLNVISLFNGAIPLIAIQMQALTLADHMTVVFTRVLDESPLGIDDEEDEVPADRTYWENRATKKTVGMVDQMLEIIQSFDPDLYLRYNKFYIGIGKGNQPYNFVSFIPKKTALNLHLKLPKSDALDAKIDAANFDTLDHTRRMYRLRLTMEDLNEKVDTLRMLAETAYRRRSNL